MNEPADYISPGIGGISEEPASADNLPRNDPIGQSPSKEDAICRPI